MKIANVDEAEVFADGDRGPVVLMLHGWPDTRLLWEAQVAALSERFRCVRFTLPGFEAGSRREQLHSRRCSRYILAVSTALTLLVGVSRIMFGVHWTSHVLVGRAFVTAWAMAWLILARRTAA